MKTPCLIPAALAALAWGAAVPARAADPCPAYAELSARVTPDVEKARALMRQKDIGALKDLLPALEAHLAAVPATPPEPQLCGGEVQVYERHQHMRLVLGRETQTLSKTAPLTYVDLKFAKLAYVVGWTQYELGDYEAAKRAYAKGLAIAPNDHDLVGEYAAVLMQLADGAGVAAFTRQFLIEDMDLQGPERANLIALKALGEMSKHDYEDAWRSVREALFIDPENGAALSVQQSLVNVM